MNFMIKGPVYLPKKDNNDGHYYVKYRVLGSPPTVAVPTHFFKSVFLFFFFSFFFFFFCYFFFISCFFFHFSLSFLNFCFNKR